MAKRRARQRIGSKQDLARRFRRFREAARLTQEQVAEKAGLSSKFLSQIETARVNPSIDVVARFVIDGLELSLPAFFGPDDVTTEIEALLGRQPAAVQRRALHVLRALCEELP
ncbi:MAG: helix-turn-helix transcriptional regulator [Kofleriaceae bacterium]